MKREKNALIRLAPGSPDQHERQQSNFLTCEQPLFVWLVVVCACLSLVLTAQAEVILYEGFDYKPGESLEGKGPNEFSWGTNAWLKHYATSDWLIFSGSLPHPSLPTTGGHVAEIDNTQGADYERRFNTHLLGDGDSFWFSFLVKVTQGASWNLYFTSSQLNASSLGIQGNYIDYGIHARIGVGYNASAESIDLGQNITRLIVGRYCYSASDLEQLDIWMDPVLDSEPQPGGSSSSNHIVHTRQLDSKPDRIDSVLLEDRSIGSLAFDELRVGTSWADVISRVVGKASIDRIEVDGGEVHLDLSRLTPGATTTVQRATELSTSQPWQDLHTFVPWTRTTNWSEPLPLAPRSFYRINTR